jgi:hypothetical protein
MPHSRHIFALFASAALILVASCASTKTETAGTPLKQPLCQAAAAPVATAIYWAPQWRPNQKEPPRREAAALRGIQDFVGHTGCLAVTSLQRLPAEAVPPSNEELLRLAAASNPKPERVVLIVVRELGPRLVIGLPVIVEGGTEVLVDVRVLDPRTSESLSDAQTLWRNGGKFVIKGVKTLERDMSSALSAALMPAIEAK